MSITPPGISQQNNKFPDPMTTFSSYPDPVIALSVQNVSKSFGSEKQGRSLPGWLRRNGHSDDKAGTANGKPAESSVVIAVDNVSMAIRRGEIFGVLGPNGSGKSTLIRCISTLLVPDRGEVKVFGYDVEKDEMAVKRLINRVSVEASFFKKLSVGESDSINSTSLFILKRPSLGGSIIILYFLLSSIYAYFSTTSLILSNAQSISSFVIIKGGAILIT